MTFAPAQVVLRDEDAMECMNGGMTPQQALERSIAFSTESFAVHYEGDVLAYWGWTQKSICSGNAWVWMLSTPAMDLYPRWAARESKVLLDQLLDRFCELECLVDGGYAKSIRWLEWLGFTSSGSMGAFVVMKIQRGGRA